MCYQFHNRIIEILIKSNAIRVILIVTLVGTKCCLSWCDGVLIIKCFWWRNLFQIIKCAFRFYDAVLLLSVVLVASVGTLKVNYKMEYKIWENLGNVYTCSFINLTVTTDEEVVTTASGFHQEFHNNNDIMKLNIENQICHYLPKGMEGIFPNLEGLRIASSELKVLRQTDISVFPNLRNCDVFNNHLTSLDPDLFARNPNLEYLYFGSNYIREVGHNILGPLKNLKKANFDIPCIGDAERVLTSFKEFIELQRNLNENCPKTKTDEYSFNFFWWVAFPSILLLVIITVAAFLIKYRLGFNNGFVKFDNIFNRNQSV